MTMKENKENEKKQASNSHVTRCAMFLIQLGAKEKRPLTSSLSHVHTQTLTLTRPRPSADFPPSKLPASSIYFSNCAYFFLYYFAPTAPDAHARPCFFSLLKEKIATLFHLHVDEMNDSRERLFGAPFFIFLGVLHKGKAVNLSGFFDSIRRHREREIDKEGGV